MEATVAQVLQKLRWSTVQGPYYIDPVTGKSREIDVVGQQHWRRAGSVSDHSTTIQFVVECKSIKGWHILFQPVRPRGQTDHRYEYSFGWELEFRPQRLATALEGIGMSREEITHTRELLDIYQRNVPADAPRSFTLDVPRARKRSTTFRETNIGNEKEELEQSVLWRAMQLSLGAIQSMERSRFETDVEKISFGVLVGDLTGTDRSAQALASARDAFNNTVYFHPVVVLEAQLWVLSGADVRKTPWVRLEQRMLTSDVDRWVDIVQLSSFASYAKYVTRDYDQQMRAAHAKRAATGAYPRANSQARSSIARNC